MRSGPFKTNLQKIIKKIATPTASFFHNEKKEIITTASRIRTLKSPIQYPPVTESHVNKNATQRRPGIHTDKYPNSAWGGPWGGVIGEIYIASTADDTCRVWNCHIEEPGHMGDCEHLRDQLQKPISLKANQLVWMTDSCPHEALPQNTEGERQFFRLVSPDVGLWYKSHSTPNPLVELPSNIRVIEGNKFTK